MIDTNKTKTLVQASERLHKLNMKCKALEIEESVFVVNKPNIVEKKLKVSADIRETLCLIEECIGGKQWLKYKRLLLLFLYYLFRLVF